MLDVPAATGGSHSRRTLDSSRGLALLGDTTLLVEIVSTFSHSIGDLLKTPQRVTVGSSMQVGNFLSQDRPCMQTETLLRREEFCRNTFAAPGTAAY